MIDSATKQWLAQHISGFVIKPFRSGANNQGFIVETKTEKYFLKCYPKSTESQIRIKREIAFIQQALQAGAIQVAQVIASSLTYYCVLFEFIAHQDKGIDSEKFTEQAFAFVNKVNKNKLKSHVLEASESSYQIDDFINAIDNRLLRLQTFIYPSDFPPEISVEIQALISRVTEYYQALINNQHKNNDKKNYQELLEKDILSPSDFGLHNALNTDMGIYFIDFEYAGKDSLWKFIADFFAQPQFPIPLAAIKNINIFLTNEEVLSQKDGLCFVYHLTLIKWCLLMLQTALRQISPVEIVSSKADAILIRYKDETPTSHSVRNKLLQIEAYFSEISIKVNEMQKQLTIHFQ